MLFAVLLLPVALHAEMQPVRLVPADDAALASMVLLGAGRSGPVVLFDPQDADGLKRFVGQSGRPVECLVRASTPTQERTLVEASAGVPCTVVDELSALARRLWPQTRAAVLVPAGSYEWLLRGAALAGATDAALLPVTGTAAASDAALAGWALDHVYVLADVAPPASNRAQIVQLRTPEAVTSVAVKRLQPPATVVVANPRDRDGLFSPSQLSLLAPLIAATQRAPLVLVSTPVADAVEAQVRNFIAAQALSPTHIYLVGDELALRSHRVPDPVLLGGGPEAIGGGREVRVELFSELQHGRPQDYAVGRFVAESAARGSVTLAHQLHAPARPADRVRILSNADEEFELGETISRTTASELRNLGVTVRAQYRDAITPAVIQEALEQASLLVWEGHARDLTLEERGGISVERTPPLVVLQGCYTLDRSDPFILFERGTQAIVATSAAIYSASGSAFARALLDALLYDRVDLGTAVRNARNYLLALTELKKRRQHSDWTKTYRAALAFALWGDPSGRPPLTVHPPKIEPARWQIAGDALDLVVPTQRLKTARVGRYEAAPIPRAMLGGLILRDGDGRERQVKELFYAVVPAPGDVGAACSPAPGWDVVSLLAPRTRTLSVLARPLGFGQGAPAGEYRLPLVRDEAACAGLAVPTGSVTPPSTSSRRTETEVE